jgi:hypothetical protein
VLHGWRGVPWARGHAAHSEHGAQQVNNIASRNNNTYFNWPLIQTNRLPTVVSLKCVQNCTVLKGKFIFFFFFGLSSDFANWVVIWIVILLSSGFSSRLSSRLYLACHLCCCMGCHFGVSSAVFIWVVITVVIWGCHLGCQRGFRLGCHLGLSSGIVIQGCHLDLSYGLSSGVSLLDSSSLSSGLSSGCCQLVLSLCCHLVMSSSVVNWCCHLGCHLVYGLVWSFGMLFRWSSGVSIWVVNCIVI